MDLEADNPMTQIVFIRTAQGPVSSAEAPETFRARKAIANLDLEPYNTVLYNSHILNMNRGSLHAISGGSQWG